MILIQELVKKGLLNKETAVLLDQEIKNSGKKEEEIILEKKIVSEDYLFNLKSAYLNIPLVEILPENISLKILELIPEEVALHYQLIPLRKEKNILEIGMIYPDDLKAREALEFWARQAKLSFKISLITISLFKEIFKRYQTIRGEVSSALTELEKELKEEESPEEPVVVGKFERIVEEAPISKVVAVLLRHAIDGNATDIHIEPVKEKIRVRFRLDGILHSSIFLPLKILPAIISKIKILSNLKIDETRLPQDGRFTARVSGREIDFRVSTFPTMLGEKAALRVLDPERALVNMKDLGLSEKNLQLINKAIQKPYGMILVTGPTGCGKTSTLYAILRILNKEGVNIVTLEDPVEYFIEGINQSQIKPEIGYDFASGLRFILRQDPNVLMIGEVRDEETAFLAIHASLTGHLVLSTLHTNNAVGVVSRLIDMGIKPFLISPTLSLIISQRLIRKVCPDCRKLARAKKEINELIIKELKSLPEILKKDSEFLKTLKIKDIENIENLDPIKNPFYIYEAAGCKNCNQSGYMGRIGIFEILEISPAFSDLILKNPSEIQLEEQAKKQGMITLKQDGVLKVLEGLTTIEEALRVGETKY